MSQRHISGQNDDFIEFVAYSRIVLTRLNHKICTQNHGFSSFMLRHDTQTSSTFRCFCWVLVDFCLQIRCFVDVKIMSFRVFVSNNFIQRMIFILNSESSDTQKCFDWSSHPTRNHEITFFIHFGKWFSQGNDDM